jgi:hypothetical protein
LREKVRCGEIIRVRRRLFGVISVECDSIRVNRLWRDWTTSERKEIENEQEGEEDGGRDRYAAVHNKKERMKREKNKRTRELIRQKEQEKLKKQLERQRSRGKLLSTVEAIDEPHAQSDDNDIVMGNEDDEEGNEELDINDGERIYRVPLYKNEDGRLYFYCKYKAYDWTIGNPLTQLSLRAYSAYSLRKMRFSLYMMKQARKQGNVEEAREWKERALEDSEAVKWAQSLSLTGESFNMDLAQEERNQDEEKNFEVDNSGAEVYEDDAESDGDTDQALKKKPQRSKRPYSASSIVAPIDDDTEKGMDTIDPENPTMIGEDSFTQESASDSKSTKSKRRKNKRSRDKQKEEELAVSNETSKNKNLFSATAKQSRKEKTDKSNQSQATSTSKNVKKEIPKT